MSSKKAIAPATPKVEPRRPAEERFEFVRVDLIDPAKDNPRKKVGDTTELEQSIKAKGILQPLRVTPRGKRFVLVAGERRWTAAKKVGLKVVPCMVQEMTDAERLEAMLVENMQRVDLTPLEEARTISALEQKCKLTQRDIATRIGKSQPLISKRLALLKLPAAALSKLDSGRITLEDAADLAKLADKPKEIERILKRPGNVQFAVDDYLRKQRDKAAIAKIKADCKAKGIVCLGGGVGYFNPPHGTMVLGNGYMQLPIDPKKHAAMACHAVGIGYGKPVACCTDRSNHPELTKGEARREQSRTPSPEEEARLATVEELKAAAKRREELHGPVAELDGLELIIAAALINSCNHDVLAKVLELLDVEYEPLTHEHWTPQGRTQIATMRAALQRERRSPSRALKIAAMFALIEIEDGVRRGDWTLGAEYFRLLARAGHTPCPAEAMRLSTGAHDDEIDIADELLEDEDGERACRVCRVCGCTDYEGCDGGCMWVEDDLCSSCHSGGSAA